jgi:hypothetical protein
MDENIFPVPPAGKRRYSWAVGKELSTSPANQDENLSTFKTLQKAANSGNQRRNVSSALSLSDMQNINNSESSEKAEFNLDSVANQKRSSESDFKPRAEVSNNKPSINLSNSTHKQYSQSNTLLLGCRFLLSVRIEIDVFNLDGLRCKQKQTKSS